MAFAARGPQFTTLDITADEFRRARDLGLRITVHVGDGLWGTRVQYCSWQAVGFCATT